MRYALVAVSSILLTACGFNGTDRYEDDNAVADRESASHDNLADEMASADPAPGETVSQDIPDSEDRPMMQLQVVLDRQGFGPGVIDGKMGISTENALRGFQEANDLETSGKDDEATKKKLAQWDNIPATRVVRIPEKWAQMTFKQVPDDAAEQAEMERLGYNNLDEKLAERFHTTIDVLKQLNPGGKPAGMKDTSKESTETPAPAATSSSTATATPTPSASETPEDESTKSVFAAGQLIRVPNIGADRIKPGSVSDSDWQSTLQSLGVGTEQPEVSRVVVSEKAKTLKAYDSSGDLVALFTVTSGSENDPLPLGEWGINGVGHNPPFSYNPELFWDVSDDKDKLQLPPGPNGPVGVVWIDLTKEHYGIHGTPEPQTIGRTQSHGCVRLTNWDAARLSQMVSNSTKVIFEA